MSINIQKADYKEMREFLESKGYHLTMATFIEIYPGPPEEDTSEIMYLKSISELSRLGQIHEMKVWADRESERWCGDTDAEMADHIEIIFEEEVEGGDEK